MIHFKKNECLRTIEYYERLIEKYPTNHLVPEAYYHIGLCHSLMGNPDQSAEAYTTLLDKYSESRWAGIVRDRDAREDDAVSQNKSSVMSRIR